MAKNPWEGSAESHTSHSVFVNLSTFGKVHLPQFIPFLLIIAVDRLLSGSAVAEIPHSLHLPQSQLSYSHTICQSNPTPAFKTTFLTCPHKITCPPHHRMTRVRNPRSQSTPHSDMLSYSIFWMVSSECCGFFTNGYTMQSPPDGLGSIRRYA